MLGSNKTVLGIDIGSVTVKLIEMGQGKNSPVIVNYAISPIPGAEDLDKLDDAERNQRIGSLIQNIIKDKKIKAQTAVVSISSRSVFTRFVKMPFSDPKKLERLINFEAQQQIPFPLDEVSWDHEIVGRNQDSEYEVLIAAIKQEILNDQFQMLSAAGVSPEIFDVGALASYNALLYSQIQEDEKAIILDIGANPAIMIIHQPEGYWVRTLSYSSNSLTQNLMRHFGISFEEAESLKFKGFIINDNASVVKDDDVTHQINNIITKHARKLYTEVVRSLSFYRTQFSDIEFDRIILSGGGCQLDDLKLYLGSKFKLTVDYADPLANFEISPSLDTLAITEVGYLFSESLGLALRKTADCKVNLNLMTVSANIEKTVRRYMKYIYFIWLVVVLSLGFSAYTLKKQLPEILAKENKIDQEISRIKELKKKIKKENKHLIGLEKELGFIGSISDDRGRWLTFFVELTKMVPEDTYISRMQVQPLKVSRNIRWNTPLNVVLLSGEAGNGKKLDEFKNNLSGVKGYKKIDMLKASITSDKKVEFEMKLFLE